MITRFDCPEFETYESPDGEYVKYIAYLRIKQKYNEALLKIKELEFKLGE
jgi:hypothetical protein